MNRKPRLQNSKKPILNLPEKANLILNIILVSFILILLRVWHLSVIQYEHRLEESQKPQKRVIVEAAQRGTIRDRFNIPLAINKIQYQAALLYAPLKEIPMVKTEIGEDGVKVKKFKRREYIQKLAEILGKELDLDPERIEDLIHSKAAFFSHVPYVLKEDLSEEEYYRLKMLEKDWKGIQVQRSFKRHYPMGKVAGDILGYMGAINKTEYDKVTTELKNLENWIENIENGIDEDPPHGISSWEHARNRLKDLREKTYTINDFVGKSGIEGSFEEELRGYRGKKIFYTDSKGNFLRESKGSRKPESGKRLLLTISAELQQYAEFLLIQNEKIREAKVSKRDHRNPYPQKQPWIKGGGIIALDPNNGEIVAMATYPRFDPNDFIPVGNAEIKKQKRSRILKWFETEQYLGEIWDQKKGLDREIHDSKTDTISDETLLMNWSTYLNIILPKNHPILEVLERKSSLQEAFEIQQFIKSLLLLSEQNNLYALLNVIYEDEEGHETHRSKEFKNDESKIKEILKEKNLNLKGIKFKLSPYFSSLPHQYDKVLLLDLYQLALDDSLITPQTLSLIGFQTIETYRNASAAVNQLDEQLKSLLKDLFHENYFKPWRKIHEKTFLKEIREKEIEKKQYHRPYIEHFDYIESVFYQNFWEEHRWELLKVFLTGKSEIKNPSLETYYKFLLQWHQEIQQGAHQQIAWMPSYQTLVKIAKGLNSSTFNNYFESLRPYQRLNRPLYGFYNHLRKNVDKTQIEKHLATAFYPTYGYGYGRSSIYRQATTQGSIFKLVTAYEALVQKFQKLNEIHPTYEKLNPLTMIDQVHRKGKHLHVGYDQDGVSIPQMYRGGRLLKSASSNIGKIDLLKALETSSNPHFSLLAGEVFDSANDLLKAAKLFGFGTLTGLQLPYEIKGNLPKDLETNRTGLYAMANGQHTLVVTPLQTSIMLAAIANGGKILQPKILKMEIGKIHSKSEKKFQECMKALGIEYSLFEKFFTNDNSENFITHTPSEIKRQIFMPTIVRNILLEGMRRVVNRQVNESLRNLSKIYKNYPEAISDYIDLQNQLIGKTSTSEKIETLDCDRQYGSNIYTHIWFGGISFLDDCNDPEIMVFRDRFGQPELVVVVYLRFGIWGKEASPLAAQIVKKWREIKARHALK